VFTIDAAGAGPGHPYIQSVSMNGRALESLSLRHDVITSGGEVKFTMGPNPNRELPGINAGYTEYSPKRRITTVPVFARSAKSFTDSLTVAIEDATAGATVYFTTDGTVPNFSSPVYSTPLTLVGTTPVQALAAATGRLPSRLLYGEFTRFIPAGTIESLSDYSPQYTGGGRNALIDGLTGTSDFRLGQWQGYEGNDLEVVIRLTKEMPVREVSLGCLQDINSWIFFPTDVEVSLSDDGVNFGLPVTVTNDVSPREEGARRTEFLARFENVPAGFVRIRARNLGTCPDWHKGAGGKAWLFVDEVKILTR